MKPAITIKMPLPKPGRAVKAGQEAIASFAHHAPSPFVGVVTRMARPKGGKGPRN